MIVRVLPRHGVSWGDSACLFGSMLLMHSRFGGIGASNTNLEVSGVINKRGVSGDIKLNTYRSIAAILGVSCRTSDVRNSYRCKHTRAVSSVRAY